jgi:hypothetical protein
VATAPPAVKPSTQPRLSEAARHVVWPSGIVSTDWPVIEARLALMGVSFDLWQVGIGQLAFAKRDDDKYACTIGGVSLSIPRQVGKTFAVGMMIIAFCLEYPGSTVLWTAHRTRTSTKTFQSMQGLVKGKRIKPHLAQTRSDGVRATNGEQQIEFRNGSVIMFGAREGGFGRGFDEVDVEVFDEAQILTEKALEDMVAATNQSRHPHGALLFFMGTPPRPDVDPGEEFASRREEALSGDAEDMVYVEFSADENCEPNDREQWAKANPSFPGRTPLESMLRMRKNLRNVDSWRREALGIWPNDGDLGILPGWSKRFVDREPPPVAAIGVAASVGGEFASIASSDLWPDGKVNLSAVERRPGTAWVVAEAKRIQEEHGCTVLIDEKCPDDTLPQALIDAGVQTRVLKLPDLVSATSELVNRVREGSVTHQQTTELDDAVAAAVWRDVGDGRRLPGRKRSDGPIDMLEAAIAALQGAVNPIGTGIYIY